MDTPSDIFHTARVNFLQRLFIYTDVFGAPRRLCSVTQAAQKHHALVLQQSALILKREGGLQLWSRATYEYKQCVFWRLCTKSFGTGHKDSRACLPGTSVDVRPTLSRTVTA